MRTKTTFICAIFTLIISISVCGCTHTNNDLHGTWNAYKVVSPSGNEYTDDNIDFDKIDISVYDISWINSSVSFNLDKSAYLMRPSDTGDNGELSRINGVYSVSDDMIDIVSSNDNDDVCHMTVSADGICFKLDSGTKVYYSNK